MKPLNKILYSINLANDRFRTLELGFVSEQSEILRDLSCAFVDLIPHKKEARENWINAYNSIKGSNASKERHADSEVMEYDLVRDIMKAVELQMNSIRSTLSANKNQ